VALLTLNTDGTLTLTAWTRRDTSAALTAATVTWAVYGPDGSAATDGGDPATAATGTLTHTSGGTYTGTVESTSYASLAVGEKYRIAVTAVQGGFNREFNLTGYVQRGGGS
jgi:hypothetical protein